MLAQCGGSMWEEGSDWAAEVLQNNSDCPPTQPRNALNNTEC